METLVGVHGTPDSLIKLTCKTTGKVVLQKFVELSVGVDNFGNFV